MANSDFVTQFYNLEGELISERKKNFFKLLKAQSAPLSEEDLKNLCPRTYLEKLFLIDVFIHFKITTKLLDVIKEGNEIFISKILKHPSLLLETIGAISAETFVNDFLPCTSYALRMKILKRISVVLGETQMDDIATAVEKRYGLYIASKIIHTCSSRKIKDFLSKHEIILKPRQVKFIFDKDPDLFLFYLDYYKTLTGHAYCHPNLSRHIALKNPDLWLKIDKEQTIQRTNLGRKTSKNLLRRSVSDLVNNVKFYSEFLKLEVVVRKLHGNFKEVYFQLFPKDVYNINMYSFCSKLLKLYPKKRQWELFTETYTRVFGNNILDNLIYLNTDFLKLFPNKAVMNKWAEVHYAEKKSNDLLKYQEPSKAIPLIKEKINVTSDISSRNSLVTLLMETCLKNDDLATLEAVLKYICFRHRNEDNIPQLLDKIRQLFKLEEFNENHWNSVNEMITIIRLKKQMVFYCVKPFFLKYIEYLISQGKPFKKELIVFIKDVQMHANDYDVSIENPKVEKQILTEIMNVYPEILGDDKSIKYKLLRAVIDFNSKNPTMHIELTNFPTLFEYVKSLVDNKKWDDKEEFLLMNIFKHNFKFPETPLLVIEEAQALKILEVSKGKGYDDSVKRIVMKRNRTKFENDVLQFFWDNLLENHFLSKDIIHWLFVNDPKAILPHFDQLLAKYKNYITMRDMERIKLLSHLNFDRKVVDYCKGKLEPLDEFLKKASVNAMEVDNEPEIKIELNIYEDIISTLCILLTTNEYLEFVSNRFLPVKKKINTADEVLNQIYFLQCEVAKSFRYVQEPALVLPTLMKFCLGDYLKFALPSLYSVSYRAPEKMLYSYMDLLSKRAVSVRKHSLFLSCELLSFDFALDKLRNSNQKNVSSQKHIFSTTLKYFRKNPSELLLNLVADNLSTIDKNDSETLVSLVNTIIPKKYRNVYIEKCWYFLESLRSKEVDVQVYLQSIFVLTTHSEASVESLPLAFCRHIISQSFKDRPEKDYYLPNINRFVCYFLRRKSEQTLNFKFIFDIVATFKENKSRETIQTFFNTFYETAMKDINKNNKIDAENNYHIELFKQHWSNAFTPIDMFDEHMLLNLLYLRCKSSDNLIENYAKEVVTYLEQLVAEYGPYIYYKFKDLVLHKQTFNENEKYLFFYNVLNFKNTTVNCILVIDLLTRQGCSDEVKDIRCKIMEILKSSDQPVVWVYLNRYFGKEI